MKTKTLGLLFLNLVQSVLRCEDKELCDYLKPKMEEVFLAIKHMGLELTKSQNGGKLPNPDSVGWTEDFWKTRFAKTVYQIESLKRVNKKYRKNHPTEETLSMEERIKKVEEALKNGGY